MRIVIDAILVPGRAGGVEQVARRMIEALGRLDGDEEYIIVTHPDAPGWLADTVGPNQQVVPVPRQELPWADTPPSGQASLAGGRSTGLRRLVPETFRRPIRALRQWCAPAHRFGLGSMARPDRFMEELHPDVIYYPFSVKVVQSVPSVVTIYDLQHKHYPHNFNKIAKWRRDTVWPQSCATAAGVVAISEYTRKDLIKYYRIPERRIHLIRLGPTISCGATKWRRKISLDHLNLPATFALYPAQTWSHKNHPRLLDAIAYLRDHQGIAIPVVCPGRLNHFWPAIKQRVRRRRLGDLVRFPGHLDDMTMAAVYRRARVLIFPSLFEGGGLPLLEAFAMGVPVSCSTTSSLVEYAGDAALLFDPTSVREIANALKRLWSDSELRNNLVQRGQAQASKFSWGASARKLRALLRACAGATFSEEDKSLPSCEPDEKAPDSRILLD